MADVQQWPWLLNQPFPEDVGYPAEIVRGQHFDSTSGGNGVSSPRALKVQAQPAPDGTVQVLPGGGTAVSNYAGVENQSYQATNFKPYTLDVPPTGSSSGGRHDLIIQRFLDPQYEKHPDADGELTPEVATTLDFWWFEVVQGGSADTKFSFPHVKLAHIKRPENTTIVEDSHITDLRRLANPQSDWHVRGNNMQSDDYGTLSSKTSVWPTDATHTMRIPEYATRVQISGHWNTVAADTTDKTVGLVHIDLTHPDGSVINTENSRFQNVRVGGSSPTETLNVVLSDSRPVPEKFRGQLVTLRMRGTKVSGPNIYMDGNSSWEVRLYFEQEIS